MLEHALKYTAIGWPLHPVSRKKIPLTEHGSHDATCDEESIRKWFGGSVPVGIGLATGEKSKIAVIDFDLGKPSCVGSIEEFKKTFKFEPSPIRSITGSGGEHHFYRIPEGRSVANAVAFKGFVGVDVRGNGGYVVLPPSYNSVGQYAWADSCSPFDAQLPEAPEFLYGNVKTINLNWEQTERLDAGMRNTSLTAIAGRLRASGLEHDDLLDELLRQNVELCNPPLERAEVEKIVDSICRYPAHDNHQRLMDAGDTPIVESSNTEEVPTRRALLRFARTDAGRAEMVRYLNRGQIRYNFRDGKYYMWDGSRWRKDSTDQMNNVVVNAARLLQQASQLIADEADRKDALNKARSLENAEKIRACLGLYKGLGDVATRGDEWDSNPYLLGVKNGVVDLRTGELLPPDRDILMVMDTNINYNPQATCPRWEQFIREVFNDDEALIDFVHKASGYALTGLATEECIFLLVGDGSNGKSVFLSTIMSVMGDYGTVANFSTFEKQMLGNSTQTNDVAALVGKRLVTSSETSSTATFNEARIKALTGGEQVSARFLYQEQFNFMPVLKLWLAVNHAPRVQDESYGFWRRIRRINFTRQFIGEEADPQLSSKLKNEAEGILMWLIRGAGRWLKEGLFVPDVVQKAVDDYRNVSDTSKSFLDTCVEFVDDPDTCVSGEDMYARYGIWCKVGNIPIMERMSRDTFHTALSKHIPFRLSDRGKRVYTGVRIIQHVSNVSEGVSITVVKK